MNYSSFLREKTQRRHRPSTAGDSTMVNPILHEWQRMIVAKAVGGRREAVWADTGLGKSFMQVEVARLSTPPGGRGLIVAPLAVCKQTIREAAKLGVDLTYRRADGDWRGLSITNFEMVDRFDARTLDAVALDEASILKDVTSKTRDRMIAHFAPTPARSEYTATPSPNDVVELANHAEFLGIATRREMLATYFVHDATGYRVKGHARGPMYGWMATWATAIRRPSDLGFSDAGYDLPPLTIVDEIVDAHIEAPPDQLFAFDLGGVTGRAKIRRETLAARTARAAELVEAEPGEPWLLWCGLNEEAQTLARDIPGAVNVHGAMAPEEKAELLLAFADGEIRTLITKPSIAAMGLNWPHCARMAFVGLSDSYEAYYQAARRCWRYGQSREVRAHVIVSEVEAQIPENVRRKEREHKQMTDELIAGMRQLDYWKAA